MPLLHRPFPARRRGGMVVSGVFDKARLPDVSDKGAFPEHKVMGSVDTVHDI